MHNKGRFPNVIFGARLQPESATLAIVLTLLGLIFVFLFMTLTAQLAQGQSAQNAVPPTARQAAASPAFASRLAHPSRRSPAPRTKRRTSPLDSVIYSNGPVNGTVDAWTINFGYSVSDSFTANGSAVTGFDFYVWAYPGDTPLTVDWSITSQPLGGGTVYGSGTASVTSTFISSNQYGYDIDKVSATGLNVSAGSGWLNLQNASTSFGNPLFWDENSGVGCNSPGCPSLADQNSVGTIPSEAFDLNSGNGPPPCFQSGGDMEIIHDFNSKTDGGSPSGGVVADATGNVYGAMSGGQTGFGFVYEIASRNQLFNTLYNFTGGPDGGYPNSPIVGPEGVLYGTANGGCCGLVYSLRPGPTACLTNSCRWTESSVYQFTGTDGVAGPGNLLFDHAGNLYGTSAGGGAYGNGAVFELSPSAGGWTETILYSFTGGSDGGGPNSLIVGIDGNLYGTTVSGGGNGYECTPECGVVFQLVRPLSGGTWTENVIYSFTGMGDGGGPYNLAQDGLGNLLGIAYTTYEAGATTVFELSPSSGSWVFNVVFQMPKFELLLWSNTDLAADTAGNVYWARAFLTQIYGGEALLQVWPPGGGFSTIYNAPGLFFPSGPLGLDANRDRKSVV